jgi:hypothetical protein
MHRVWSRHGARVGRTHAARGLSMDETRKDNRRAVAASRVRNDSDANGGRRETDWWVPPVRGPL